MQFAGTRDYCEESIHSSRLLAKRCPILQSTLSLPVEGMGGEDRGDPHINVLDAKKVWQELEARGYKWAFQAMNEWADCVKEACKTKRSLATTCGLA